MVRKPKKKHKEKSLECNPSKAHYQKDKEVQQYLQSSQNVKEQKCAKHKEHHQKHGGKHKRKHKHKHAKIEEKPQEAALIAEKPCEPAIPVSDSNAMWWNGDQSLPSSYIIAGAELNFGLGGNGPMRVLQPVRQFSTLVIPELRSQPANNTPIIEETLGIPESPANVEDWLQDQNFRPISPIKDSVFEYLPTSEDIWLSYEACKQGAEPAWPLCCPQNIQSSMKESIASPVKQLSVKERPGSELDEIVASITDWKMSSECKEASDQLATCSNMPYVELDSLHLSLDEERGLVDFLKSKRLHTPLSDIKAFEMLLSMARNMENRNALLELLKPKHIVQLKPGKALSKRPPRQIQNTAAKPLQIVKEVSAQETRVTTNVERSEAAPVVVVNNETLQQAINSLIVVEQPQQQQREKMDQLFIVEETTQSATEKQITNVQAEQPLVISVEKLPPPAAAPKPQEDAVQQWLQQLGQDLSRVVQSRLDSMPNRVNAAAMPIDFETEINQIQSKKNTNTKTVQSQVAISGIQWENSYKQRLDGLKNAIDQKMTEFRDPQAKRLRSRWVNELGKSNLDSLKRDVLMPPLPSHMDQGLQQIRILRPPTKRKIERAKLQVEMKLVRTYSTIQAKCNLDMSKLALELDNAVYNSDIQVLQKRYEDAHVAWIWPNGTMLISNARSKAILGDTQNQLVAKIQGGTRTDSQPQDNALYSQTIHIAQFPWHICIEEFSKTYALSTETVQRTFKYAYYVNKNLAGVAAKVYESGAIQVFAMTADQADGMFEKLYLLTANHRKPKSANPPKQKLEGSGKFIPLYPT